MNTKNTIVSGLTAAVAGLSLMACSSVTGMGPGGGGSQPMATNEPTTTFKCIQADRGWATIAERGNAVSKNPLFTWNSLEFGDKWTPENRCYEVTRRLNTLVGKNGGKLSNLNLTYGKLKDQTSGQLRKEEVVCVVNQQSTCTDDNLLFTLSQKNSATPRTAITKITDFSQGKAGASPVEENGYPQYFPLQDLVNLPPEKGF